MPEALTGSVAVELVAAASATARLPNREVRSLALGGRLPLGTRQGGANQAAVHGAVVFDTLSGGGRRGAGSVALRRRIERRRGGEISLGEIVDRLDDVGERFGTQRAFH